jgi:hypothetical protein
LHFSLCNFAFAFFTFHFAEILSGTESHFAFALCNFALFTLHLHFAVKNLSGTEIANFALCTYHFSLCMQILQYAVSGTDNLQLCMKSAKFALFTLHFAVSGIGPW